MDSKNTFLRGNGYCRNLYFYRKSMVIYDMTFYFVKKYLPPYGDRTVDQMIQAARSGKQNFVEGMADGVTSFEMQIKLINVGKSSLQELREDYEDYLRTRNLKIWKSEHPRYDKMLDYCKFHNDLPDYEPFFTRWNDEEFCNVAITLIHYVDKMLEKFLLQLQDEFVKNGGIKEAMTRARLNTRNGNK
ncbi:MAG: four helix bundle suffix domain-containing protein [Bacteroidales bacterium]|jgi:four helix bundle suffix protein|nr:four helix bundle suffix domain-containing protein [Bacteroidales bacterium]